MVSFFCSWALTSVRYERGLAKLKLMISFNMQSNGDSKMTPATVEEPPVSMSKSATM